MKQWLPTSSAFTQQPGARLGCVPPGGTFLYPSFALSNKLSQVNFLEILLKTLRNVPFLFMFIYLFYLNTHQCLAGKLLSNISFWISSEDSIQVIFIPLSDILHVLSCFALHLPTQPHFSFLPWISPSLLKSSILLPSLKSQDPCYLTSGTELLFLKGCIPLLFLVLVFATTVILYLTLFLMFQLLF